MKETEDIAEPISAGVKADSEASSEEVFVFPTTVAQRRFWLLDQLEPGNPALNVPLAARLTGRLDRELLERAVNEILCRHEILRTSFRTINDNLVQVIHAEQTIRLACFDLTQHPESEQEVKANELILEEGKRPFMLAEGPFLRGGLIKLRDDEHILLLSMHHIVCDGWSNGILIREVAQIYTAFSEGKKLPELQLQYADFAQWQKNWLESPAIVEHRQFWLSKLQGVLPFLNLPTDHPRNAGKSRNSTIHTLLLPQPLTEALRDFCNRENLTLFMVFFATYATLLYRYTGQRNLIVGSPAANRSQPELEDLIGLFSNPLVMRLNFSDHLTLRSLLAQVRDLSLEVFEHQSYPFEKLLEEIQTDPHRPGVPLLQAYFIFQKAFMQPQQMPDVTLTPLRSISPGTLFEWMLGVLERAEGIRLQLEYDTDLFDQATVDRMLHHFQQLLKTVVTDQDARIDTLPILTPVEIQQIVIDWNGTQLEIPRDRHVHELFEEQVRRTPDALAIQNNGNEISYTKLNRRANQVAHFLRERGGGPDSHVGLVINECSLEFPAYFLGILKAGACCVVLNPQSDDLDLEKLLCNDSLDLIVAGSNPSPILRLPAGSRIIKLEADAKLIDNQPDTNLSIPILAEQPACIFFTSGFSGLQKGSVISHRALLNSTCVARSELDLQSHDRVTFSLTEMLPALLAGAMLAVPARNGRFNPANWLEWVRSQGVTIAALPTTWWHELVQSLPRDKAVSKTELRLLAIGGSDISPSVLSVWQRATTGRIRLLNRYLLAETAGAVAFSELPVADLSPGKVSIVRPAPNSRIYLLDANLRPVPIGVPGNIYVGGDSLAMGYWVGAGSSTADFVVGQFFNRPGERLLKTGDAGRFLAGGGIELLGRIEDLEQTEGFRLELCEIRSTLFRHSKIWDVAVIPQEISDKRKIVAYIVNKENHPVQSDELRSFIAEYLPAYMVPAMFVMLPSLPLTPGGKIDRMALPVPGERHLGQRVQFEASSTATEVALANIWCKLLGVDKIGIHENFFAAGGHSLLAVRMINEIRQRLAPDMPVRMPFQYPTIQELAKALLTEKFTKQNPELIQLQAGNSGPEIFLIVDGDSVGLFKLSHFMDKELRLYASVVPLPEPALKASAKKQFSAMPRMEDMAAAHVALIKSRPKTGPIVLVGYCIAGMIAFEVAQQLQAAGIRVEAVLMLNTWMKWPTLWWRKKAWWREFFGKLLQQGPLYLWHKSQQRISKKKADVAAQLELAAHEDFKTLIPQSIVNRINRHAVIGYRPIPLASHGILLVFEDDWMSKAYQSVDNSLGASKLFADGLEVINVPADNVTVMEEKHLANVAGYFNKCLKQFR